MGLGKRSRREVARARHPTTAAMRAQARDQGRYLCGRPPYGYRLVDAGPHPNAAHAAWGRRLQRLDPDPATAPHVQWIFAHRLAGYSLAGIARDLNDRGVPCPSAADRPRNQHRHGGTWSLQAVRAIVANPRYTGRQVWNRQHIQYRHTDGGRVRVQQTLRAPGMVAMVGGADRAGAAHHRPRGCQAQRPWTKYPGAVSARNT